MTIPLVLSAPIARADIKMLCECAEALLKDSDAGVIVCDVGALVDPDAVTVDALARLQLTARRYGRHLCFRDAGHELRGLITLMGLGDVVRLEPGPTPQVEGAGRRAGTGSRCRGRR